ncbi:DUF3644 domain-containing protein [Streptomyces iakyrus]|uniref:DUF3644 domain-containing protein n=1 Tax=Streptomyces iakyrus TaxID=68219 RepID=UPI00367A45A9
MIDNEPKAWDLEKCLREHYTNSGDPVRLNAELFVALRNKMEHRYEHNLKIATGGKAQALVMNYEQETVDHFGSKYSLADQLRFPISPQVLTAEGREQLQEAAKKLPKQTRDLVANFEAAIAPAVLDDLQYDFRVRLVPMVGAKTDADLAIDFVKLDELSEEERKVMIKAGHKGTVIVRDRQVEVADKAKLRAKQVSALVEERLPFEFSPFSENLEMWQRFQVRPAKNCAKPYDTDARYCIDSEAFNSYLYTPAWVEKIVREIGTPEKYRAFFGKEPRMTKVIPLPKQAGSPAEEGEIPSRSESA